MKDELESPTPPHIVAASAARDLPCVNGRVPVSGEVLAQIGGDLRDHARAIAAATNEVERRCCRTARLGEELEAIEQSARRMTLLVDDLIDVASIRRGALVLCRDSVRLEDLIEESLELLRGPVRRKQIQLDCPAPESPVLLRCDEERVLRLLTNLILLAVDVASDNAFIAIRMWNVEEGIRVAISDPGSSDRRRERGAPDAGLGVQLARAIADAHGGSIDIELDSPLAGPMISLRLPRDLPAYRDRERHPESASR